MAIRSWFRRELWRPDHGEIWFWRDGSSTISWAFWPLSPPPWQLLTSPFAISTYGTDWVLVPEPQLETAQSALVGAGHRLKP